MSWSILIQSKNISANVSNTVYPTTCFSVSFKWKKSLFLLFAGEQNPNQSDSDNFIYCRFNKKTFVA